MAIINSCLLCCCGPSAPIVLKAKANVRVVYWAFIPALHPIRATAACLCPVEHVSGSVQTWPCCWSENSWSNASALSFLGRAVAVAVCVTHVCVTVSSMMGPLGLRDLPCRRFVLSFPSELHGMVSRVCLCMCRFGSCQDTTWFFHQPDKVCVSPRVNRN